MVVCFCVYVWEGFLGGAITGQRSDTITWCFNLPGRGFPNILWFNGLMNVCVRVVWAFPAARMCVLVSVFEGKKPSIRCKPWTATAVEALLGLRCSRGTESVVLIRYQVDTEWHETQRGRIDNYREIKLEKWDKQRKEKALVCLCFIYTQKETWNSIKFFKFSYLGFKSGPFCIYS